MLEVVALSALTAFLTAVGNGAAGEMGKQLLLSTGALVGRTTGRTPPVPTSREGWQALAGDVHACLRNDGSQASEWSLLMRSLPEQAVSLPSGSEMPPASRNFTNRQRVVRQLKREATRPAAGRPRVGLLYGPPGSGTTAVALRLGALCHGLFPDGQYYVDLRDVSGEPGPSPAAVLLHLLRRMGVEPEHIPPTESGREQLYRRLLSGRRAMVVIDHVSHVAQVRGLVPSTPDVFLLAVVSGQPFRWEAERVVVPPLNDRYARKMMTKVAGRENIARVKRRMPDLLEHCAGNAFALQATAMSLQAGGADLDLGVDRNGDHPSQTELPGRHPVRDTAQLACGRVQASTARLCRLTALGGWPSINARLAAAAAGVTEEEAARMLAEAVDAQLLEPLPDGRHRFRPEVHRYLADTAALEHGIPECSAAIARTLDALLNRALHAAHAALPQSWRTESAPAHGEAYRGEADGVPALATELGNLARAISLAMEYQHIDTALSLGRALWPLQLKAGFWDEVLPALRVAARCADEHQPLSRMAGALHFQLSHCLGQLGLEEEANAEARSAVTCEKSAGHLRGEASSTEQLGLLHLHGWLGYEAYEQFVEAERLYNRIAPGEEGAEDVPRALALIWRHQGCALRLMRRFDESRELLECARDFFKQQGEAYNQARALTDLAETLHEAGENTEALLRIAEAERLLDPSAVPHLGYLAGLRLRCEVIG
ncbi:ATP-binding protein [Streptomyces sp. NPDC056401]|uniref:ATP-binding protein n=1 Tax=Streptomyces sp. NPDC056401 TaxID=3345809 RepID=UPI0035E35E1A